jgi:NitT/TauT family transport system substrate-binding protein
MNNLTGWIVGFITAGALALGGLAYRGWVPSPALRPYHGPYDPISISTSSDAKSALLFIAQDQGYFSEHGLEVTLKVFQSGKMGFEQLQAGKIDIANAADFVLVEQIFAGARSLRCLGAIGVAEDHYLIVWKGRGILEPRDLSGKRIGVPWGTTAEFFLGRFLAFNNLSLKEVGMVDIKPAELANSLAQGRVDAVMVWQRWAEEIKKQQSDQILSWPGQNGQAYYWLLVATDAWVKARPGVLERLFRALYQAERFLKNRRAASLQIVARRINLDPAIVKAALNQGRCALSLDQSLLVIMEDEARWMIRNHLTEQTRVPNYLEYIDATALSRVNPAAVSLIIPKNLN